VNPNNDVISASVDELRSAVGVLELPPPPSVVSCFFLKMIFKCYIIKKIYDCLTVSLTKQSKFRPKSALNDRIVSGTQTLRLKASSSRCSVVKMFLYLFTKKKLLTFFPWNHFHEKYFVKLISRKNYYLLRISMTKFF